MLIGKRIRSKKFHIMPKVQSPKIRGAICNVPIDAIDISNSFPCQADSNGLVIVKMKRRLQYRGHVYIKSVRP